MKFLAGTDFWQARKFRDRTLRNEFTEGTTLGGLLSLVGMISMVLLFFMEFNGYLTTSKTSTIEMDGNTDSQIFIELNVTLPNLACSLLSVDVEDVMGVRPVTALSCAFFFFSFFLSHWLDPWLR